jgi:hypothetical protein
VLDQYGKDFESVAGVVLLVPFQGWRVIGNPAYKNPQFLKKSGLLKAIGTLKTQG